MPWVAGAEIPLFKYDKICKKLIGRSGKNGTVSRSSSKNHRLYWTRLDNLFFKVRFTAISMQMKRQIKILQIKNRLIKVSKVNHLPFFPEPKAGAVESLILLWIICHLPDKKKAWQ